MSLGILAVAGGRLNRSLRLSRASCSRLSWAASSKRFSSTLIWAVELLANCAARSRFSFSSWSCLRAACCVGSRYLWVEGESRRENVSLLEAPLESLRL